MKCRNAGVLAGLFVCGLLFPAQGWGQSRLDSIQHIDEVVITAKTYKEP